MRIKLTYLIIIVVILLTVLLGYFVEDKMGWGTGYHGWIPSGYPDFQGVT